jgi:hypothetical protein
MQRREGVGLYRAYLGRVSGVANSYKPYDDRLPAC